MAKISWDQTGERRFETGTDRGVLYPGTDPGVAWNGLVNVTESPSGGEATPYYMDGIKYENAPDSEDFGGTIDAFTYPPEFEEFDGYDELYDGISLGQQARRPFHLSYRTLVGNDVLQLNYGYKIHLVYNATVAPSARANATRNDTPEPLNFSWPFTTKPVPVRPGVKPTAHIVIDSNKINPGILETIEEWLYGTSTDAPKMLMPLDIINLYDSILPGYFAIDENFISGISPLIAGGGSDLKLGINEGIYRLTPTTRLVQVGTTGIYTLED